VDFSGIGVSIGKALGALKLDSIDFTGIFTGLISGFDFVVNKAIEFGGLIKSAFDEIVKSAGGLDNLVRILTIVAGVLGTVGAASILLNPVTLIIGGIGMLFIKNDKND